MSNLIVNPLDNIKYNINSKKGLTLLKNYIKRYNKGGIINLKTTKSNESNIPTYLKKNSSDNKQHPNLEFVEKKDYNVFENIVTSDHKPVYLSGRFNNINILIISWNTSGNDLTKLNNALQIMHEKFDKHDIVILGFQEVKPKYKKIKKLISKYSPNYKLVKDKNSIFQWNKNSKTCLGNFKIMTFCLYKNMINLKYNSASYCYNSKANKSLFLRTKGFVIFNIKLLKDEKETTLSFINSHFPFKKFKHTVKMLENLKVKINNIKYDYQFLFGDLNSRSLLKNLDKDSEELCNLDVDIKKEVEEWGNFCENTESEETKYSLQCVKKILENNPDLTDDKRYKLIKKLKKKDSWKLCDDLFEDTIIDDFEEEKITFLPTYKYKEINGEYKLEKKGKLRLPGYADRIFYRKNDLY